MKKRGKGKENDKSDLQEFYDAELAKNAGELAEKMRMWETGLPARIEPTFIENPKWLAKMIRRLYWRTRWEWLRTGWECNGKRYDKSVPYEQVKKENSRPIKFRRFSELPRI